MIAVVDLTEETVVWATDGEEPSMGLSFEEMEPGDRLKLAHALYRHHAGTPRLTVDMHGTGAALRQTTAVFGPRQSDAIADGPQKRHLRVDIELM